MFRVIASVTLMATLLAGCSDDHAPPQHGSGSAGAVAPSPISGAATSGAATSGATTTSEVAQGPALALGCDLSKAAVAKDGKHRLALLVGVGDYQSDLIPDLRGPPRDIEAIYRLLTDPQTGYGFPAENVCVLRDGDATLSAVKLAFEEALIARAQPGDTTVFYYSGHGTQVPDRSRDEADEKDEAFLLHDSWTPNVGVLRDDELNAMLARLHEKTDDITLLLDACTSGGLSRGVGAREKQVIRPDLPDEPAETPGGDGDYLTPASLPGLVVMSAARDGSLALEPPDEGLGYFTSALVDVLGAAEGPVTWGQVGRQIPRRIEQMSDRQQFPLAQGALDRVAFGETRRGRPLGWEVVAAGDAISLEGAPLPGWGVGAELRVYPGEATREDAREPAKAKATLRVERYDGLHASARLVGPGPTTPLTPGDLAVLSLPGPESWRLAVGFDASVPAATRDTITMAIAGDPESATTLVWQDRAPFTLLQGKDGALRLRGPEGVTRNVFTQDAAAQAGQVRTTLVQHARQQALLAVRGSTAGVFQDDATLEVRVVPRGDPSGWVQSCPNFEQQIPRCGQWAVEVRNTHASETLRIGGLILSSDGAILAMPQDGRALELPPGGKWTPLDAGQIFQAVPPLGAVEDILVFGALRDTNINWSLLAASDPTRPGAKGLGDALEATLARYVTGGAKAVTQVKSAVNPWTLSHLPFRAVANVTADADTGSCDAGATAREYTVANFDITPYLPADQDTALYKVLKQAEYLTHKRETDGVPYRQHSWSEATDAENLAYGIDCSRAIWFAFTRAGLPYTSSTWQQGFQPTAQMFDEARGSCNEALTPDSTLMKESFVSCLGEPFQTGDVLVWQGIRPSTNECVGHTVMVIDPDEFIGWGSHGWDGSKSDEGKRLNDTGVEYQRILARTWAKWDRKQYELKACWRHKQFIAEAARAHPAEELYLGDGFACDAAGVQP